MASLEAKSKSLDNDYGATRAPNAPASHTLHLFAGDPGIPEADGGGVELDTVGGYAPVEIPNDGTGWQPASNGLKVGPPAVFPTSTAAWSDVATHWALLGSDGYWWDCGVLNEEIDVTAAGVTVTVQPDIFYDESLPDIPVAPLLAPVAAFSASVTSGTAPLEVTFTDESAGPPASWAWDFGDGGSATTQNPAHTYSTAGTYTITLTVSNDAGTDTATGTITATSATDQPDAWDPATMLGADQVHPNDTGMTYLADCYEWALDAAGKTPTAGTLLTAYGDSYTAADTQNTVGMRAIHQLRDRLGLTLTNRAVSGYRVGDCAATGIGTTGTFVPGTGGIVFLQAGINDVGQPDTAQHRVAITNYMRALFAVLCAEERLEEVPNAGVTGTWAVQSGIQGASGGNNAATTTEGSTVNYTIGTPGTYYLLTHGTDTAAGGFVPGGQMSVSQGGVTLATVDLQNQAKNSYALLTNKYGPLSVRVPGVTAGTLTVTFSTLGRSGAYGWIDALVRLSATPPTILAVKPVEVPNYAPFNQPALLDFVRDQYDVMAAEFGANVVVCDPDPSWTA